VHPGAEAFGGERGCLALRAGARPAIELPRSDELTNDSRFETLDLLQEMLGDYPALCHGSPAMTVTLDRVATSCHRRRRRWLPTEYAGGYSDMVQAALCHGSEAPRAKARRQS
jgi:ATP-binding cassette subfamily F protein uup